MSTITTPKIQVPLGFVTIGGVRYDVAQHPEFVRFFFDLIRRVGGSDAKTNTEIEQLLQSLIVGEMVMQPAHDSAMSAETIQQAAPDPSLFDVTQSAGVDVLGSEMTWQS